VNAIIPDEWEHGTDDYNTGKCQHSASVLMR